MALTEDLRRLMGFDQGPDNNSEVHIKIKPLGLTQPVHPSEPSVVGAGTEVGSASGAGGLGPVAQTPASTLPLGFGQGGQSIVPLTQQRKNVNPTLVTHPLGSQTDDIYESSVAQLVHDTQVRNAQLLQELGYVNDQGQFLPGTLETDAIRQRAEYERQQQLALQDVLESAVRGGTVFSGRRATLTNQAQAPFDAAISELGTKLSRELANRYQSLGDLTSQFELSRNQLISAAAERAYQRALAEQGIGGPGDGDVPGASGSQHPNQTLMELHQQAQQEGLARTPVPGATPGAPPPARPAGMPSTWRWNQGEGYWQSPDGKYFLVPGKPWGSSSSKSTSTASGAGGGGHALVQ